MTDINDLVQDFWITSSDVGAPFFAMPRLLEKFQVCFIDLGVCFDIISVFATAIDLADKIYSGRQTPIPGTILRTRTESEPNLR